MILNTAQREGANTMLAKAFEKTHGTYQLADTFVNWYETEFLQNQERNMREHELTWISRYRKNQLVHKFWGQFVSGRKKGGEAAAFESVISKMRVVMMENQSIDLSAQNTSGSLFNSLSKER